MITAIVGPSGSGKTTITRLLDKSNLIILDDFVAKLYTESDTADFFMDNKPLHRAVTYDVKINKGWLLEILIENPEAKIKLEDYIFSKLNKEIVKYKNNNEDLFVDGVMPRFLAYFDRVIYVEMREEDRISNIMKRGVSREKAQRIIDLQDGMFNHLLPERK